jgi:Protein of unknown function (DUF1569)
MKTIFDKATRDELITRINLLDENNTAQWGKMNVYQMLKHCTLYEEWILGKGEHNYKQLFIGRLFGTMQVKQIGKSEKPMPKNVPTLAELKVKEKKGDAIAEKKKWINLVKEYEHYSNPDFIHSFFGKMTKEQIGYLVYQHTDHHLRQFNG